MKHAISPTRAEDYPEWYQQVVSSADLAENSPVRGCMVIKPWGYSLWENIQNILDRKFKDTGCQNAYFPLFIPKSFIEKEAEHIEGFAKECAVVTHTRLHTNTDGKLAPADPLEEPLIVRPTSETIIGAMFSKWVQSYRDLPLRMNQWANVVRWELRTRLFLRTTEFLWQEGHTIHTTAQEAITEARRMLDLYAEFAEHYMAIPVIKGVKTPNERFPGAIDTYSIEALMQDRKALQTGTSHFLGQNFSKSSNIQFLDRSGHHHYAWSTSWGVSTRLIGSLIMTHADDDGLILPPRLAPLHAVILPIFRDEATKANVLEYSHTLKRELSTQNYDNRPLNVHIDERQIRGGEKLWQWIKKGVPLRIEVGPRDYANRTTCLSRRDHDPRDRTNMPYNECIKKAPNILQNIQNNLFARALKFRETHTITIDSRDDFYAFFTPQNSTKPEIHGGFAQCHWSGTPEIEEQLKTDLKVTIRCLPFDTPEEPGTCPFTGEPTTQHALFAKAY